MATLVIAGGEAQWTVGDQSADVVMLEVDDSMAKRPKSYVVWKGREPGVYATWSECQQQISGFRGAEFKAFASREAAEEAFAKGYDQYAGQDTRTFRMTNDQLEQQGVNLDSLCTDAACSGNPGLLEYQGVLTRSGSRLFHKGPFHEGTSNIGEFLAIVHALAWLKREGRDWPVYSDSKTAISWVRRKCVNSKLKRSPQNRPLFQLVDRAVDWLDQNTFSNQVIKWQTESWGENPADFGRKSN